MNYTELNLNEKIQQGLSDAGYVTCTPVQEQVLKASLDGSDLYVQSQTGTGKTAAFLVTIMQEILARRESTGTEGEAKKNALILVPTRELAVQVEEEAAKLGKHTGLKFASFYGGVGYEKQVADLKKGVDIIIGTPGRVIDLTEGKQMDLSNVGYLAIDEADRMFDMGFYPDLRKLIHFLPKTEGDKKARQTMLFSATLNSYVKNLAWEYTREAKEITIEAQNITVDEIDQELIHVSSDDKMKLLLGIFKKENPESVIIFCDTKKMCEIVSKRLQINGIKNEYIIGDLPQSKRLKIMDNFKAGKVTCLVATDVAARGIDVNDLAMVVNYDLPNEAENYVHRIGRTARAGKSGKAYTFCSERDVYSLAPIERYIEKQIPSRVAIAEDFEEDKSKDVYIRLDSEERDGKRNHRWTQMDTDGAQNRGKKSGGRKSRKEGRKSYSDDEIKSFRGDKSKNTVRRASDEEIAKLSGMSSDERIKYFKEKYAKSSSSVYKNAAKTAGSKAKSGKGRGTSRKNPSAARKTEKAPKKLGLIARLKSLIGRGK
ncbi:MAG: DEAD/DEAH box helicase [Treponema sp.]|uniref:DEAD/DEAH box helicase n=1 Tax=Treponema sp. TaxID=166 RepID=UPI0025FF350E|nr:DEAD/DEAH box helicase [Treponema sp.]MBR0497257.1 DEAD/DEAH box helicase [Treponema sp.]